MSTELRATREELDAQLEELRALPTDGGTLELIVVRPREGERETPESAEVPKAVATRIALSITCPW